MKSEASSPHPSSFHQFHLRKQWCITTIKNSIIDLICCDRLKATNFRRNIQSSNQVPWHWHFFWHHLRLQCAGSQVLCLTKHCVSFTICSLVSWVTCENCPIWLSVPENLRKQHLGLELCGLIPVQHRHWAWQLLSAHLLNILLQPQVTILVQISLILV